jgi:hypothetical protein
MLLRYLFLGSDGVITTAKNTKLPSIFSFFTRVKISLFSFFYSLSLIYSLQSIVYVLSEVRSYASETIPAAGNDIYLYFKEPANSILRDFFRSHIPL